MAITTIIIYFLIFLFIILRGLYISRKSLCNIQNKKIAFIQDCISLSALPFYLNQGKINLFIFFFNLILIILFGLINGALFISTSYCMEYPQENDENMSESNSNLSMSESGSDLDSNESMSESGSDSDSNESIPESNSDLDSNLSMTSSSESTNTPTLFQTSFSLDDFLYMFSNKPEINNNFVYLDSTLTADDIVETIDSNYNQSLETYVIDKETELFFPTIESFSFPGIKKIDIYNLNTKSVLKDLNKELEIFYQSTEHIKFNFLSYPYEDPEITDIQGYRERLESFFDRNSLFISKLYALHEKIIIPYSSEVNNANINSMNPAINFILNNNNFDCLIRGNIKTFLMQDTVKYQVLDAKIKLLLEFLLEINQGIDRQNEFFNNNLQNNPDSIHLNYYLNNINFMNCLNFELNPNYHINDDSVEKLSQITQKYMMFGNLNNFTFEDTHNSLRTAFFNEDQLGVRNLYRETDNFVNQQFIRNFPHLHESILNKGLVVNYTKIPGFRHYSAQ